MDPAVKAKWVAALRSGKYEQGREGYLMLDDKFCCLGVLCEIEGQSYERDIQTMPSHEFLSRIGLDDMTASYYAAENDAGVSFVDIANKIEFAADDCL